MINVQIDEVDLLNLLMDRMEYWTQDEKVLNLYEEHLRELIDNGCFEGVQLDIKYLIDNLYVNDTTILSEEELTEYDDHSILAKDLDNDLYLVTA